MWKVLHVSITTIPLMPMREGSLHFITGNHTWTNKGYVVIVQHTKGLPCIQRIVVGAHCFKLLSQPRAQHGFDLPLKRRINIWLVYVSAVQASIVVCWLLNIACCTVQSSIHSYVSHLVGCSHGNPHAISGWSILVLEGVGRVHIFALYTGSITYARGWTPHTCIKIADCECLMDFMVRVLSESKRCCSTKAWQICRCLTGAF